MKGFIATVLILSGIIFFSSCGKTVPDIKTLSVSTFEVDSVPETTYTMGGVFTSKTGELIIGGQTTDGTVISLDVLNPHIGNYTVASNQAQCSYSNDPSSSISYYASTGSVTINYISASTVIGSFSYTVAVNGVTRTITNGLFNCSYIRL